jgi:hypothetical protein
MKRAIVVGLLLALAIPAWAQTADRQKPRKPDYDAAMRILDFAIIDRQMRAAEPPPIVVYPRPRLDCVGTQFGGVSTLSCY